MATAMLYASPISVVLDARCLSTLFWPNIFILAMGTSLMSSSPNLQTNKLGCFAFVSRWERLEGYCWYNKNFAWILYD